MATAMTSQQIFEEGLLYWSYEYCTLIIIIRETICYLSMVFAIWNIVLLVLATSSQEKIVHGTTPPWSKVSVTLSIYVLIIETHIFPESASYGLSCFYTQIQMWDVYTKPWNHF